MSTSPLDHIGIIRYLFIYSLMTRILSLCFTENGQRLSQ